MYRRRYGEDVYRTKCRALTIARLTRSPCTTQIARIMQVLFLSARSRPFNKFTRVVCVWGGGEAMENLGELLSPSSPPARR